MGIDPFVFAAAKIGFVLTRTNDLWIFIPLGASPRSLGVNGLCVLFKDPGTFAIHSPTFRVPPKYARQPRGHRREWCWKRVPVPEGWKDPWPEPKSMFRPLTALLQGG